MIHRICHLPENKSFFLFGPRQTGKTTLVNALFGRDAFAVDLLKTETFLKYSKNPERLRLEVLERAKQAQPVRVIIDEIQRVPELLNEVHWLIENTGAVVVMTGSSARKLKRSGVNLLAGRAAVRSLFPFVYQEIADTFDLAEALQFGTLPAVHGRPRDEKIDILKAYTQNYLKEEIQTEGLVRNLGAFSRFLDLAASQFGELLSFSAIGRECHVATRTVQGYYENLEDTLIGFRLPAWQKSLRRRLTAHPKFYLFDLGVTNSINRQLTALPDPVRSGRLFEQFIITETHRMVNYQPSEALLYYWRTNHGAEVDLLIEKHGRLAAAFEIKNLSTVTSAHLSGLRSFGAENPDVARHIVARVDQPFSIEDVLVMPWRMYLERLGDYLC